MVPWQSANGMRGRKRDGEARGEGNKDRGRGRRMYWEKNQRSLNSGQWKRAKLAPIKNISNPSIFSVVSFFVLLNQFFNIS